jgi:hypothetical protein
VYSFRDPQTVKANDKKFGSWLAQAQTGWRYSDQLWDRTKGNQIVADDPRYGWVALFRREPNSAYAQIYVIVTRARVQATYTPARDLLPLRSATGAAIANLQARPLQVRIVNNQLTAVGGTGAPAVAEGAYVIIANDNLSPQNGNNSQIPKEARVGWMNGRIYRVGNRAAAGGNVWDLMPGNDFARDAGPDGQLNTGDDVIAINDADADAFVVGRTFQGASAAVPYDGPAQDVAIYTTFVQLR